MYNENQCNKPLQYETVREFAKMRNEIPLPEIKKMPTQRVSGDLGLSDNLQDRGPNFQIYSPDQKESLEPHLFAGNKRDREMDEVMMPAQLTESHK